MLFESYKTFSVTHNCSIVLVILCGKVTKGIKSPELIKGLLKFRHRKGIHFLQIGLVEGQQASSCNESQ